MKKIFVVLLIIMETAILSSCFFGGKWMFSNDNKIIDEKFKQIIKTFKDRDKEALKLLFSEQALIEIVNFDEKINTLFEFIQGEIGSWKRTGGPCTSEGKNDDGSGRIWKEIRATYDILIDEQIYHISFQIITKHSQDTKKVGISSFCIINANDWNEKHNYWGDLGLPKDFKIFGIIIESNENKK